ncbi:MAG TPA: protoporphyrinogen oxidase [Thermoanaerobaculia bacterium]|nr:protoporphyrinogen oxidase [Thermoanaerobaculia bacterium]
MTGAAASGPLDVAVVGGGIAGLAASLQLASGSGCAWALLEREARWGGVIRTERQDGYLLEGGPDCFLASKPGGLSLCRALGIEDRLVGTIAENRRTFVKRDGRLHRLPEGISGLVPSRLRPLMTAPTLSLRGRLRAGLELFVPRRRDRGEQSIAEFVTRRFGRETYDWLVEPLLSGIFAGDGDRLSLDATFPRLIEAEREHGSVLAQMLRTKRRTKLRTKLGAAGGRGRGVVPGAAGGFVTPRGGLGELVGRAVERLPSERLWSGVAVEALAPTEHGYRLRLDDGRALEARAVVLAVPAHAAAPLLQALDSRLAAELEAIQFVATAIVSVGFAAGVVRKPLDGYGYVSPRAEGGPVVACSCTSNKFPGRAEAGATLFRFFLGRAGREEIARESDEVIQAVVRRELREVLGVDTEPEMWRIFRWPRALPQYDLGHLDRLDRIDGRLRALPGLRLAGASYRGVGIPDCIESGERAAREAMELLALASSPRPAAGPAAATREPEKREAGVTPEQPVRARVDPTRDRVPSAR